MIAGNELKEMKGKYCRRMRKKRIDVQRGKPAKGCREIMTYVNKSKGNERLLYPDKKEPINQTVLICRMDPEMAKTNND